MDSLKKFNDILEDDFDIYLYGNGKRGEMLFKYLYLMKYKVLGYIVSKEYYDAKTDIFLLEDICNLKKIF